MDWGGENHDDDDGENEAPSLMGAMEEIYI